MKNPLPPCLPSQASLLASGALEGSTTTNGLSLQSLATLPHPSLPFFGSQGGGAFAGPGVQAQYSLQGEMQLGSVGRAAC